MEKILITGSTGFLGKHLTNILQEDGFSLLPFGNNQARIDITSPFSLSESVDIVVHSAGKAHSVPKTSDEAAMFHKVNYEGTVNLCEAISRLEKKPSAFIFISSVSVYGVEEGEMINEEHGLDGDSPYALSKISAEKFLVKWGEKNAVKIGILRLPLIAGPNPPGNLGAMIRAMKSRKYLSIGSAKARKSMVWIDDIAKLIPVLALTGGTFNITDGHHPSFKELEKVIAATLRIPMPVSIPLWVAKWMAKIGDSINSFPINTNKLNKITSTLTFDDTAARKALGWAPNAVLKKLPDTL